MWYCHVINAHNIELNNSNEYDQTIGHPDTRKYRL